jgi:2-polyprenyl-3-methyl-5-hydroxy-6-metoxy-1,4-benzoquinol methylase
MQTSQISKKILEQVGFANHLPADYSKKDIKLRDGRDAVLWVNDKNGHGILDPQFWQHEQYYAGDYRKEFNPILGKQVTPEQRLKISRDLNYRQYQQFSHLLKASIKYLEVGCSFGGILKLVCEHDLVACDAVEPNELDAAFVKQSCAKASVFNSLFEQADLADNYYDLIVSFEVLEHTVSPRHFLTKAIKKLNAGGILHLEVPNHHDALLHVYQNEVYKKFYYHKAHIHYFTPDSLSQLCAECGLQGAVSGFQMYAFPNQLNWLLNSKPQASAEQALAMLKPCVGAAELDTRINNFFVQVAQDYNDLVEKGLVSDCLIYQGSRNG